MIERLFHRSDYRRWTKPQNLEAWWEPRTKKIAEFIPRDSRVIEFGSGTRSLARYLDSSCTYFPSDLVYRGPGTIICDLNKRPLPDVKPTLNPDIAVFAGVLEYVRDLPAVVEWLSHQVPVCVASYTCAESEPGTIRRLVEMFRRSYYGYLNEYREEEIIALFQTYGFVCVKKDRWTSQLIFLFALSAQSVISVQSSEFGKTLMMNLVTAADAFSHRLLSICLERDTCTNQRIFLFAREDGVNQK